MWIATSYGFLMPAIRPPKTVAKDDDRTLQVRARRPKDLDILRAEYMKGKLGPTVHTPKFDYEYRAYCTPEAFALAVARMIVEIDYLKFKPTTDRYEDNELHDMYNSMWGTILSHLSSKSHQHYYWTGHKDGKVYAAESARSTGSTTVYRPSSTGYPRVVSASDSASPIEEAIAEHDRYRQWWEDAENGPGYSAGRHRDTSADRDEAARVPDVIDADWSAHVFDDDVPQPGSGALARVDAIQAEIDAVLDDAGPIDHVRCRHRQTPNAKAKCRAKHRGVAMKRISALRDQMDAAYRDAEADFESEKAIESASSIRPYALS